MSDDLDIVAVATELVYAVQVEGNSYDELPGFVVDRVFNDLWDNTGFYAVGFANRDAGQVVIAIRGSEDRLDVVTNANLGIDQYLANREPLLDYVGQNIVANSIYIAGHSLGGGLSQYLGYDAALQYHAFRDKLTVQTHNGFGGIIGITKMHGSFDPAVVAGSCGHAHYQAIRNGAGARAEELLRPGARCAALQPDLSAPVAALAQSAGPGPITPPPGRALVIPRIRPRRLASPSSKAPRRPSW